MFLKRKMNGSTNSYSDKILQIKEKISQADAVIIGAGAGLSTSAGFVYTGERFKKYFSDFFKKFIFDACRFTPHRADAAAAGGEASSVQTAVRRRGSLALCAVSLSFDHPVTGRRMTFAREAEGEGFSMFQHV